MIIGGVTKEKIMELQDFAREMIKTAVSRKWIMEKILSGVKSRTARYGSLSAKAGDALAKKTGRQINRLAKRRLSRIDREMPLWARGTGFEGKMDKIIPAGSNFGTKVRNAL